MPPPGFNSLPTEVIIILLRSLSSSKDLYSLTRASAKCYRTFALYQSTVSEGILQNAIHPEAQEDALMVVEASRIKSSVKTCLSFIDVREDIFKCLEKYSSRKPPTSLRELATSDREQLKELFRLYSAVEDFIADFCGRALRCFNTGRLSSSTVTGTGPISATLSPTELARLQRAFFRFETFASMFDTFSQLGCPWAPNWLQDDAEPPFEFLKMFAPWEHEEIACVTQFVLKLVRDVFDKVEDDFVHAVEEAVASRRQQQEQQQDGKNNDSDKKKEKDDKVNGLQVLDFHYMRFFKASHKQFERSDLMDFVLSRGLVFVKKLLSIEPLALRQEVMKAGRDHEHFIGNMQATLACFSPNSTRRGMPIQQLVPDETSEVDSLTNCNMGWLWAFKHNKVTVDRSLDYDLRDQGYVFWNRDRFPEEEEEDKEGSTLRSSRSPSDEPDDRRYPFGGRSSLPSVEERLIPLQYVPLEVFEELVPFYTAKMRRTVQRFSHPVYLSF